MIHGVVAESSGVTLGDLDSLLTGRVYASIADKLAVPMEDIESYLNSGSAAAALADRLGVNCSRQKTLAHASDGKDESA